MRVINIYRFKRERIIKRRIMCLLVLILTVVSCFAVNLNGEDVPKEIQLHKFVSAEDMLKEVTVYDNKETN